MFPRGSGCWNSDVNFLVPRRTGWRTFMRSMAMKKKDATGFLGEPTGKKVKMPKIKPEAAPKMPKKGKKRGKKMM